PWGGGARAGGGASGFLGGQLPAPGEPAGTFVSSRSGAGHAGDQPLDPGQGPAQVVDTVGVRQAQVPLAVGAEGGAGQAGDTGVGQEPVGQLGGGQAEAGDPGEGVEGAGRLLAGGAGHAC